jgi:prevent-host-death family protein
MATWGLAQAKARLSEVVDRAMIEGPQEITKSGKDAVVIVSKKAWMERQESKQNMPQRSAADFWLNSPLRGSGIKLKPIKGKMREVEF